MNLYASVTNSSVINSINISESHDAATAVATISVKKGASTLNIGDAVTIDFGYTGQHDVMFSGYVKKYDTSSPDGLITISAYDKMVRALDYFVVNTKPEPYVQTNIETGDLIKFILRMAGLTQFDFDNTYFTLATGGSKAEINLVGAYDYCKGLVDLIAWNMWAEPDGIIYLKNRKPFPMDGSLSQPGEYTDVGKYYGSYPVELGAINTKDIVDISVGKDERDLRNRVVIYGASKLYAEAKRADSYDPILDAYIQILPADYYKAVCLSSLIINNQGFAQDACDYNLSLLNRIRYTVNLTVIGRPYYHVRRVVSLTYAPLGISGDWYVYSCEHEFSKNGFLTTMTLVK